MGRGQALVEFALILPILMFMMLGFAELAFAFANRVGFQNSADVMVQWAAEEMASHPGESWKAKWNTVVREEAARAGCVSPEGPQLSFPDDTHLPGDRVILHWTCTYQPKLTGTWLELPITVQSGAVVPGVLPPEPTPTPTSSP